MTLLTTRPHASRRTRSDASAPVQIHHLQESKYQSVFPGLEPPLPNSLWGFLVRRCRARHGNLAWETRDAPATGNSRSRNAKPQKEIRNTHNDVENAVRQRLALRVAVPASVVLLPRQQEAAGVPRLCDTRGVFCHSLRCRVRLRQCLLSSHGEILRQARSHLHRVALWQRGYHSVRPCFHRRPRRLH